jgi:acyl-CoA synthetase (AMP-forming)/AMP-acid ligase II
MHLWHLLDRARRLHPDNLALVDGELRCSYRELGARVDGLAESLRSAGVEPGHRIAALLPNGSPYLESYFAAAGLGAVFVPLNVRLTPQELAFILQDSGSHVLIAHTGHIELVREVLLGVAPVTTVIWSGPDLRLELPVAQHRYPPPLEFGERFVPHEIEDEALAHLYYTSGTTGRAKGVMLTHRNVSIHALGTVAELQLGERDVWAHVAPMFHLADAWATFAITWVGGRHVMFPRFEPREVMAGIQKERVTITNLVPTMLNLMVKHPSRGEFDYSSLRLLLSGGAPIAPSVVLAIAETFGCEYVQTYGMTETSPYLTLSLLKEHLRRLPLPEQMVYRAKTGRPFIAVELKVADEAGRPVPDDEQTVGEIMVRGDTVTPGYWRRPVETAEAFLDGWLRTGDLAVVDSEGYVSIVDRRKDMIITGGEKVFSTEVEHVLYQHPAVLEAAVYGEPDAMWGEIVAAAVVLRPDARAEAEELLEFCRARLAGFKQVRRLVFRSELPKTGSGKIMKRALRQAEQAS